MNESVHDLALGSEESEVLQYLRSYPNDCITEMEIARRAGGGPNRFAENKHWAQAALAQLVEYGMVEDLGGRFRIKRAPSIKPTKFISPHLRQILEESDRHFDLAAYS